MHVQKALERCWTLVGAVGTRTVVDGKQIVSTEFRAALKEARYLFNGDKVI